MENKKLIPFLNDLFDDRLKNNPPEKKCFHFLKEIRGEKKKTIQIRAGGVIRSFG